MEQDSIVQLRIIYKNHTFVDEFICYKSIAEALCNAFEFEYELNQTLTVNVNINEGATKFSRRLVFRVGDVASISYYKHGEG